jgi:putative heme iron utilization protein
MAHEPRLMRSLRALLHHHRTAALATLQPAGDGTPATPFVSFVPYAIDTAHSQLVLHLSGLAAHTQQLQAQPLASLMVVQPEPPDAPVHALERATLQVRASTPERGSPAWDAARSAYLARFPDVGFMMELGDFRLVCLAPLAARHIAGFGAARDVAPEELLQVLQAPPQPGGDRDGLLQAAG